MATKNGADALSLKYKCTCCAHTVLLRYRVLQNDVEWKMKLLLLFWSAIEMKPYTMSIFGQVRDYSVA